MSIVAKITTPNIQNFLYPNNSTLIDAQTALLYAEHELLKEMATEISKNAEAVFFKRLDHLRAYENGEIGIEVVMTLAQLKSWLDAKACEMYYMD